ncbi:MAG: TadE/TadG family type IV pilus assembly protein [Micavibrio sp.]
MGFIRRILGYWVRDREGSTAIEFAIVVVPFAITAAFIIELAMVYTANSLMIGAVQDAVRAVRTGQVQVISDPDEAEDFFREQICNHIPVRLVNCNSIQFSVEVMDAFASADTDTELNEDGEIEGEEFDTGGSGDIVMVRVLYYHPLLTPIVSEFLSDSPNNTKLMTSAFVFQTEPYDFDDDVI